MTIIRSKVVWNWWEKWAAIIHWAKFNIFKLTGQWKLNIQVITENIHAGFIVQGNRNDNNRWLCIKIINFVFVFIWSMDIFCTLGRGCYDQSIQEENSYKLSTQIAYNSCDTALLKQYSMAEMVSYAWAVHLFTFLYHMSMCIAWLHHHFLWLLYTWCTYTCA